MKSLYSDEFGRPRRNLYSRLSHPIQRLVTEVPFGLCLLAVLAGILLPVFCQPHCGGHRASCMSNEKQVGLAVLQYVQDYDEVFPSGSRVNPPGNAMSRDTPLQQKYHAGVGWAGQIYPYVKNAQVFHCPNDPRTASADLFPVSYSYNRNFALNITPGKASRLAASVLFAEVEGDQANVVAEGEHTTHKMYSSAGNGLSMLTAWDGIVDPEERAGVRYVTGIMGGYGYAPGCFLHRVTAPHAPNARHTQAAIYFMADGHAKLFHSRFVSPGADARNSNDGQDCTKGRAAGTSNLAGFSVTFSTK